METVDVIRIINLLLRLAVIALCLTTIRTRPGAWLKAVAPLSWALHGLVFYSILIAGISINPTLLGLWSSALGLHVGFLIFGAVWLFVWPAKGLKS